MWKEKKMGKKAICIHCIAKTGFQITHYFLTGTFWFFFFNIPRICNLILVIIPLICLPRHSYKLTAYFRSQFFFPTVMMHPSYDAIFFAESSRFDQRGSPKPHRLQRSINTVINKHSTSFGGQWNRMWKFCGLQTQIQLRHHFIPSVRRLWDARCIWNPKQLEGTIKH